MANNAYVIEYAKSGRSSCKNGKCKQKIDKDVLRVGKKFPSARFTDDGEQTDWYHLNCVFDYLSRARKTTKRIETIADLQGYDHLGDKDQKLVKKVMAGERPPEGGPSSTPNPPSPKPKAKKAKTKKSDEEAESEEIEEESKVKVSLTSTVGNSPIEIKDGVTVLGRGDVTGYLDKKCSRQQLELQFSEENKTLVIVKKGSNPSRLTKKGEDEPIDMDNEVPYALEDGDSFTLLVDEYPYTVNMEEIVTKKVVKKKKPAAKKEPVKKEPKPKKETKPKAPKEPKAKSESTSSPKKKKSASDIEDENEPNEYDLNDSFIDNDYKDDEDDEVKDFIPRNDEDEDENFDELRKEGQRFVKHAESELKRKYGEDEDEGGYSGSASASSPAKTQKYKDGKPICKYAENCYRHNPDHLKQFWHPPKTIGKDALRKSGQHPPSEDTKESSQERKIKKLKLESDEESGNKVDMAAATQMMHTDDDDFIPKKPSQNSQPRTLIDMHSATQVFDAVDESEEEEAPLALKGSGKVYPSDLQEKLDELKLVFSHDKTILTKFLKENDYDVNKATEAILEWQES